MNRAELIDAVAGYLERPGMASTGPNAADTRLLVQTAHGEIDRLLRRHPRAKVTRPYLVPANHDSIPLPEDAGRLNHLYGPNMVRLKRLANLSDLAAQTGWVDGGNCLFVGVCKSPRQMYLDYQRHLPALDTDLSTNWVLTLFPDVYLYGALKESAVYLKDDPRLAGWEQQFRRRIAEVDLDGWNANIGTAPRMRR